MLVLLFFMGFVCDFVDNYKNYTITAALSFNTRQIKQFTPSVREK